MPRGPVPARRWPGSGATTPRLIGMAAIRAKVPGLPDRASREQSKETVNEVPGLKCQQRARLDTVLGHDGGVFTP